MLRNFKIWIRVKHETKKKVKKKKKKISTRVGVPRYKASFNQPYKNQYSIYNIYTPSLQLFQVTHMHNFFHPCLFRYAFIFNHF